MKTAATFLVGAIISISVAMPLVAQAQTATASASSIQQLIALYTQLVQILEQEIAQLQGSTATPSLVGTASCPSPLPTLNLSVGSTGLEVVALQGFLIARGYLASGNTTGFYGSLTEAGVQQFQSTQGIVSSGTPDTTGYGAVGPRTRAMIMQLCTVPAVGTPAPVQITVPVPIPQQATIASFYANPSQINAGQQVVLNWSVQNAVGCVLSEQVPGQTTYVINANALTSGSVVVFPTNSVLYTIACTSVGAQGQGAVQSVMVSVIGSPTTPTNSVTPPLMVLAATPSSILSGATATSVPLLTTPIVPTPSPAPTTPPQLGLCPDGTFGLYPACSTNPSDTSTPTQNTATLKPSLTGIISMGNVGFRAGLNGGIPDNSLADIYSRAATFDGIVINVSWAQLQRTPNSFDTTAIDQALNDARTYNQKYPLHPLAVRLRVWPGSTAPEWAKNLDGPPIVIFHNSHSVTIGHFWSPDYRKAWTTLQGELARKYDSDPLVLEVENSSCSSETDEPFVLPTDATSLANLHNAGFTDAAYRTCLRESYLSYQGWAYTHIEFPINDFRATNSGAVVYDPSFAIQVLDGWRQQLGARATLSNHSLMETTTSRLSSIYSEFARLGPVIEFQLYSPQVNWDATIAHGVSLGAAAIELWDGPQTSESFIQFNLLTLRQWSAEIKAAK